MIIFIIFATFIHSFNANKLFTKDKPFTWCYSPSGCVDEPLCVRAFCIMEHYKNLSLENIEGEIWKPIDWIKGFENLYSISSFGRVKSISRCVSRARRGKINTKEIIMRVHLDKNNGYFQLNLTHNNGFKLVKIHRLIAIAFIPNPNKYRDVNHIDGVKSNNEISNLEWVTHSENIKHAFRIGLKSGLRGELNPQSKLSDSQRYEIRHRYNNGCRVKLLALEYSVSRQTIFKVANKMTLTQITHV